MTGGTHSRRVVIKVGGSLLNWPKLSSALHQLLASLPDDPPRSCLLLAGGGALADAVRGYDQQWRLPAEVSHAMALDTMRATAKLLAQVAGLPLVDTLPDAATSPLVLDPALLLAQHEPLAPGRRLAHAWSVTSDSIAARIAELWRPAELWLLKSADPPTKDLHQLARDGHVDADFPEHAANVDCRIINLRSYEL